MNTLMLILSTLFFFNFTANASEVDGRGSYKVTVPSNCHFCDIDEHLAAKNSAITNAKKICKSEVDRISEWVNFQIDLSNEYSPENEYGYIQVYTAKFLCLKQ